MAQAKPSAQGRDPFRSTGSQVRPSTKASPVFERRVDDVESSYGLEDHSLKQPAVSNSTEQTQDISEMSPTSHIDTGSSHPEQTGYPDSFGPSASQPGMLSKTPTSSLLPTDPDLQSICGVRAVLDALPGIEHFLVRLSEQLEAEYPCSPGLLHGMFDQLGDKLQEKKRLIKKST